MEEKLCFPIRSFCFVLFKNDDHLRNGCNLDDNDNDDDDWVFSRRQWMEST